MKVTGWSGRWTGNRNGCCCEPWQADKAQAGRTKHLCTACAASPLLRQQLTAPLHPDTPHAACFLKLSVNETLAWHVAGCPSDTSPGMLVLAGSRFDSRTLSRESYKAPEAIESSTGKCPRTASSLSTKGRYFLGVLLSVTFCPALNAGLQQHPPRLYFAKVQLLPKPSFSPPH